MRKMQHAVQILRMVGDLASQLLELTGQGRLRQKVRLWHIVVVLADSLIPRSPLVESQPVIT